MSSSAQHDFVDAIERNDSSRVEYFISSNAVDINELLQHQRWVEAARQVYAPALVLATELGHVAIVDLLLQAGALIDKCDSIGMTACHTAAMKGHCDVLAQLLVRRANLDCRDSRNRLPIDVACHHLKFDAAACLIDAGASLENVDRSLLCDAAGRSISVINALLRRGVVVGELRFDDGGTALHSAALSDAFDSALLSALVNVCGIDIDVRDSDGATSSIGASSFGRDKQLAWFIDAGADTDCVDNGGRNALYHACRDAAAECVLLLIAAGTDVHRISADGDTALHAIARFSFSRSVEDARTCVHALLSAGTNIEAIDRRGVSARQALADRGVVVAVDPAQVDAARRRIAKIRIDFVRRRALQICVGLHCLDLDALQTCEILLHACGPVAPLIPFHRWWAIATTVKQFDFARK